jgi:hypothetical protein
MTSPPHSSDAHDPDTYVIRPTLVPGGPEPAVIPAPAPPDVPKRRFARGRAFPRAITWFGLRSFWGHVWHLFASVIATEDIDSRDWMVADRRRELNDRVAARLGGAEAESLTEALGRDLWIDYLADTGDDSTVSESAARTLFSTYQVADPDRQDQTIELPRGDMLIFGGDTAYPVATDLEIHNRVIVPYNRVLREVDDGRPRVLLGIPGNHDWYAGLDGFGRMFRRRTGTLNRQRNDPTELDRFGQVGHFVQWIEAFRVGRLIAKRGILPLLGYTPVQSASYWALCLAPKLDLWGIDRQLRTVDAQQRGYFADERREGVGLAMVIPDPVYAYLEPNPAGVEILEALDLSIERDRLLVLVGDTHQYSRLERGEGMHVTAGGGGAFLHPARVNRQPHHPVPKAEFPGQRQSRALLMTVPWRIASGRSGFIVHIALALIYLPTYGVAISYGRNAALSGSVITAVLASLLGVFIGGWRKERPWRIGVLSMVAGTALGFAPFIIHFITRAALGFAGLNFLVRYSLLIQYVIAIMGGASVAGFYLMVLALLGLDHNQAFSALAHPGFKHFVRLRVRKDGSGIDAWVLGKVDTARKGEPVVLVDKFHWENPAHPGKARGSRE